MIGKTLGKYKIVERLGVGGMAEVYKAYQANLNRYVAVKVIKAIATDSPEYMARFDQEAKSVAALRHPNIVQVYDFDVDPDSGRPYMVMELIEGGSLDDYLATHRPPLALAEAARIVREVCQALAYAHQRSVIHRDVKPSNVMYDASGRLILTDFGLAKTATGPSITSSGAGLGTPAYMAPEQAMGKIVDARADLYALGVIAFLLLTGQLPYWAETSPLVMLKQITEPVPDPRAINPALPEDVACVVIKSLSKSPDERFQTADEFRAAFQAAVISAAVISAAVEPAAPSISTRLLTPSAAPDRLAVTGPSRPIGAVSDKPPPEPSLPPRVVDFVGREAELAHFADQLARQHLAVITGMPGIGKTAVASELARRQGTPTHTFWHSFHEGEGVNVLIWKLAAFLAWHDQRTLWDTLQGSTQSGGQAPHGGTTPPAEVLLDYIFQMVRGQGFVLCLDDFHYVDDDPLLVKFVERLLPALEAGQVDVIIVAQRRPSFVLEGDVTPLGGLTPADLRLLSVKRGLELSDQVIADLHACTDGNAQLVMLAVDTLHRAKDPAREIDRLCEAEQIERFLVKKVDEDLSDDERSVMMAVAVLLGQAGTRDAIAAVLDGASVRRPLNDLVSRSLLTVVEGERGREYALNTMVRAYYYDLLGKREQQAMHRRAGVYYDAEEPDALRAARHWIHAGEYARAAESATKDVWALINRGEARPLRQLLEDLSSRSLDTTHSLAVNLALGEIYTLHGASQLGRACLEAVWKELDALLDSPQLRERKARTCRMMGALLEHDVPAEALVWLERGLAVLQGADSPERAILHIRTGSVHLGQGQYAAAVQALEQSLTLLPEGPGHWRAVALGNLGLVYFQQGQVRQGQVCHRRVLEIYQQLDDHWGEALAHSNLGMLAMMAGDWPEAIREYEQARALAERLGAVRRRVVLELNLGNLRLLQGEDEAAARHLADCVQLADQYRLREQWLYAQCTLASLRVRQARWPEVEALLAQAEPLARELNAQYPLLDIARSRAETSLGQGRAAEAIEFSGRAVALARELGMPAEEGTSLRVLGRAQWADGQREAALACFEQSAQALGDRDPYEAARTQAEWGECLTQTGEAERGQALVRQARAVFEKLGARRDLENMTSMRLDA